MPRGSCLQAKLDTRLLDAAEELIVEGGYEGLVPAEAARVAGIDASDGLPTEWELFAAVLRRDEDRFNAMVDAALAEAGSASQRLLSLIEVCVIDHDWSFWIELWSLALRDERARDLRRPLDDAFRERIAAVIADGRASQEFDVADPSSAADAIATLIDALAVEATLGDDTVSPNFMLGACASVAGQLVGVKLTLPSRTDDG